METANKNHFTMIQMRQGLQNILDQLNQQQWQPQVILGLNRGGCIPAIYLSHKLDVPHHVLNVSLRDHTDTPDLTTLEKVYAWQKRILIVDDINDTGATFNYIMNNFGKPERLKFAVILHNTVSTYTDIDYKGFEINKLEDPRWIVFPWEQW
jgi:xanthine phosphoribosyltransferase